MLSTKSKIELLIVLLDDIKNDVAQYPKSITLVELAILHNGTDFDLHVKDKKGDVILSFDKNGKLVANTKDEQANISIQRKYKINFLLNE